MATEPTQPTPTKTAFVYDRQSGKVVHIHQFIPAEPTGSCTDREMEETALNLAPLAWDRERLAVLHHDRELALSPEHRYRVDPEKGRLLIERAPKEPLQSLTPRRRPR